jgi:hypothetical protein
MYLLENVCFGEITEMSPCEINQNLLHEDIHPETFLNNGENFKILL